MPRSAARVTTPGIMTPSSITFLHHYIPLIPIAVHKQQQKARNEEKDDVHNPKGKAGLQHRACLVILDLDGTGSTGAGTVSVHAYTCSEVCVEAEVRTVRVGNVPQLVDACDEGADEAEVHKGDEDGGLSG